MLNETYQNYLNVNCFNGSFLYYYGLPNYDLPDGESALVFQHSMSNGTVIYQYANGTVDTKDPYWWSGVLNTWYDSDCNYTQYQSGTWAYCNNNS